MQIDMMRYPVYIMKRMTVIYNVINPNNENNRIANNETKIHMESFKNVILFTLRIFVGDVNIIKDDTTHVK